MASDSTGNSSGSSQLIQNSGSEEEMLVLMDQRKRKRMQSNRESARRSRMRKQKHLDELMSQVSQLRKDNNQLITSINITTQHFLKVEAENSILRAQMTELSNRLHSLVDISNYICMTTCNEILGTPDHDDDDAAAAAAANSLMSPLNLVYLNQPIMASADLFQY